MNGIPKYIMESATKDFVLIALVVACVVYSVTSE